jgi:hypothetical protein
MAVLEKFFQKPGHISKSEIAGICIGPIQTAILGFFLGTDLEIYLLFSLTSSHPPVVVVSEI